jgi:hypothetical protein
MHVLVGTEAAGGILFHRTAHTRLFNYSTQRLAFEIEELLFPVFWLLGVCVD